MAERIVIERLEFYGRCGVTEDERRKPQLIVVDLELEAAVESAAVSDRLNETIDYARVAERIVALSTNLTCQLLETLAEQTIENLRRMMSPNGKVYGRKRLQTNATEQRMVARAIKHARYLGLLPYTSATL